MKVFLWKEEMAFTGIVVYPWAYLSCLSEAWSSHSHNICMSFQDDDDDPFMNMSSLRRNRR